MNAELILVKHIVETYLKSSDSVLGVYIYGSRLYKRTGPKSDLDYIVVVSDRCTVVGFEDIKTKDLDITLLTETEFKSKIQNHDIDALECYFQEEPLLQYEVDFTLDLVKLRRSISSTSSNSWVKAKKKMELIDEDSNLGLKSLYHSFRILNFGIQIGSTGKIYNYEYIGPVRDKDLNNIRNPKWDYWHKKLKTEHNQLSTEFRMVAPKK